MKKNLLNKQQKIDEIKTKFNVASSIIVFDYKGINVTALEELRTQIKPEGSELKVYKNTLVKRSLEGIEFPEKIEDQLIGQSIFMFNYENPFTPIKQLKKFIASKGYEKTILKLGIMENRVLDQKEILKLAEIPGFEGLVSMLLSCLQSPMRKLAFSLQQVANSKAEK